MIDLHTSEMHIREELLNICQNAPVDPGSTISHTTADACVNRGWATRDSKGNFVPTACGIEEGVRTHDAR